MNPFISSTVAKAIPEHKRASYWHSAKPKRFNIKKTCTRAIILSALLPILVHAIDINQASVDELKSVRGIGAKTAELIVAERTRGGSFESITDLSERVKGIGPKKAAALQDAGLVVSTPNKPKLPHSN